MEVMTTNRFRHVEGAHRWAGRLRASRRHDRPGSPQGRGRSLCREAHEVRVLGQSAPYRVG